MACHKPTASQVTTGSREIDPWPAGGAGGCRGGPGRAYYVVYGDAGVGLTLIRPRWWSIRRRDRGARWRSEAVSPQCGSRIVNLGHNRDRAAMNLRRGLLRLWVVFSIAWIVAGGVEIYSQAGWATYGKYTIGCRIDEDDPSDRRICVTLLGRLVVTDVARLAWVFGPPIAVLIIGAALWWAVAGFRRE